MAVERPQVPREGPDKARAQRDLEAEERIVEAALRAVVQEVAAQQDLGEPVGLRNSAAVRRTLVAVVGQEGAFQAGLVVGAFPWHHPEGEARPWGDLDGLSGHLEAVVEHHTLAEEAPSHEVVACLGLEGAFLAVLAVGAFP